MLDRTVTDPIREELRWVSRTLGEARDAEVMYERLRALLAEEPFVEGPVLTRLQHTCAARARQGKRDAEEAMSSERYFALLRSLEELVADPPWTDRAHKKARWATKRGIRAERRRLARRVAAAYDEPGPTGTAHDVAVHDVRKAAKRFRYAWEAAVPVLGEKAEDATEAAKGLTQVLGERQDATVTRAHLVQLAREATAAGESAFTYGRLHAREEERARQLDEEFLRRWQALD